MSYIEATERPRFLPGPKSAPFCSVYYVYAARSHADRARRENVLRTVFGTACVHKCDCARETYTECISVLLQPIADTEKELYCNGVISY